MRRFRPPQFHSDLIVTIVLFTFALGLRWLFVDGIDVFNREWFSHGHPTSDAQMYDKIAKALLAGKPFVWIENGVHLRSYTSPGYPVFLSMLYFYLGDNYAAVVYSQMVMSAATIVLLYFVAKALFNARAAFVFAVLSAAYYPYVSFPASIMTETLFMFLVALTLLYGQRAAKTRRYTSLAATGVLAGLCLLTRPAGLAIVPGLAVLMACAWECRLRLLAPRLAFLALFIVITLTPWWARNYVIHAQFLPFNTMGAKHMAIGFNPVYGDTFYTRATWWDQLWRDPILSEIDRYNEWNEEAAAQIMANKAHAVDVIAVRAASFWSLQEFRSTLSGPNITYYNGLLLVSFWLFPLSGLGLLVALKHWQSLAFISVVVSVHTLMHAIAGNSLRYRYPVDWFLFMLAGCFLAWTGSRVWQRLRRGAVARTA